MNNTTAIIGKENQYEYRCVVCGVTAFGPKGSGRCDVCRVSGRVKSALIDLLIACEDEFGVPTEDDGDDEPVGGGLKPDGSPDPMHITFGMLRRARAAITP